jgi:hypothetical protein
LENYNFYAVLLNNYNTQKNNGGSFGNNDVIENTVTKIGNFIVEYLNEIQAIFKKAFSRESGALRKLFDEKTTGQKSGSLPLICSAPTGGLHLSVPYSSRKAVVRNN